MLNTASVLMMIIIVGNVAAAFLSPELRDEGGMDQFDEPLFGEMLWEVAGVSSPGGLGALAASFFMALTVYGLLRGSPWEMAAMFFVGAELTFKVVNMIGNILQGDPITHSLIAFIMLVVETVIIFLLFFAYRDRTREGDLVPG